MSELEGKTIYISGPMTGYAEYNFPAFAQAAEALRSMGLRVLSAHEVAHEDGGVPGSISWAEYLRGDLLAMLGQCSAIVLLDGWSRSQGAKLEWQVARALGWPVYEWDGNELVELSAGS